MRKVRCVIYFVCLLVTLFLFSNNLANGLEATSVLEKPIAEEIPYGSPLFESELSGGMASVEGTFYWKEDTKVLGVGDHEEQVIFEPFDNNYEKVELSVNITIIPKKVYVRFEDEIRKQYDGNNLLELPSYVVVGIVDEDVYVKGKLKGVFSSIIVGENIGVELSGLSLEGKNSNNYYLGLDGYTGSIHPRIIEKMGEIKNKIELDDNTYVPINSTIFVDKGDSSKYGLDNYVVWSAWDVYLKSGNERVEVDGKVSAKIFIGEEKIKNRRVQVYSVYDGVYEKLEYEYLDGYLQYSSNGLGVLLVVEEQVDYWWLLIVGVILLSGLILFWIVKKGHKKEKINKYKSLKRRKDYGDCC